MCGRTPPSIVRRCSAPIYGGNLSPRSGLTACGVVSIAPVLSACEVPFLSSGTEPFEMPVETPEEAITRLLEGNARFVRGKSTTINESAERRAKIAQRQRPFATIFSCVDSRVPPELVFDSGLGDLFVIRTAGNVVDSAVMGSLEYGAYELEIPLLLVLGHKGCGAVKATMETIESGGKAEGSIAYLVEAIRPAIEASKTEVLGLVVTEADAAMVLKEAIVVGDGGAAKASAQPPKVDAVLPSLPQETPAFDSPLSTGETATAEPASSREGVAEPTSSIASAPLACRRRALRPGNRDRGTDRERTQRIPPGRFGRHRGLNRSRYAGTWPWRWGMNSRLLSHHRTCRRLARPWLTLDLCTPFEISSPSTGSTI